jgi:hypothetical protein
MRVLAGFACLILVAGCSQQPDFTSVHIAEDVVCYTENPVANLDLTLRGNEAVVVDGGEQITLRFVSSVWPRMEDRYEGGGYVLTIDPEAFLQRPDGSRRGPCH